jgi:hypothetical protein
MVREHSRIGRFLAHKKTIQQHCLSEFFDRMGRQQGVQTESAGFNVSAHLIEQKLILVKRY